MVIPKNDFVIVRFAARWPNGQEDEPRLVLLSAADYEIWTTSEPPQGYAEFEVMASFYVQDATSDAVCRLNLLRQAAMEERISRSAQGPEEVRVA